MATRTRRDRDVGIVTLRGVSYKTYVRLVSSEANWHLRMTYYDGTLEIMSPVMIHEVPSGKFSMIIRAVTCELEIPCDGSGSTTFRRAGDGPKKGKGKEPDQSFYIQNADYVTGRETIDLDAGDLPPDLWIEVDNRSSSRGRLPVYAALGVPEVWRYRARRETLELLRLVGEVYEPIDRSLALPSLTTGLILEALALGQGVSESAWDRRLRGWVRERLVRPGA